nr:hypothetical protein [uncultured Rhodopila sp.]
MNRSFWLSLAVAGGLVYPFLVYFGLSRLPPGVLVLAGLALIGVRMAAMPSAANAVALLAAGTALAGLLRLSPDRAVLAYPVVISLATAAIFSLSLVRPPTVVERIARLRELELPPEGITYCRKVTVVWALFLTGNAMVSMSTALWGTIAQWTLWNGLISYLLMGLLFTGEMVVRRTVRPQAAVS